MFELSEVKKKTLFITLIVLYCIIYLTGMLSRGEYLDKIIFIQTFLEELGEELEGVNFTPNLSYL